MKKVLVISGSPRPKGNTYRVTSLFEEEVNKLGDVEFEYLFLTKTGLKYCRGCLNCMKKGEEHCPCKDDAVAIRDRIAGADGVVFISPVYVHTVSALMKNFYDRFAYMCHQPRFMGKPAMLIVSTELSGGKETLDYMEFPAFTWGFRIAGKLDVVYEAFLHEGKYRDIILGKIRSSAAGFYQVLNAHWLQPKFKELMFFNLMKTKVTLHRDMLPHDYRYWKDRGWLDLAFYYDINISPLKTRLAKMLVGMRVRSIIKEYGFENNLN